MRTPEIGGVVSRLIKSLQTLYILIMRGNLAPAARISSPLHVSKRLKLILTFVWWWVHVCGRTCVWWCHLVLLWNWRVSKVISQTVRSISSRDSPSCSHPLQFLSRFGLILEDHIVSLLTRETCSLSACQLIPTRDHSFPFQGLEMDTSKGTMGVNDRTMWQRGQLSGCSATLCFYVSVFYLQTYSIYTVWVM